MSMLDILINKYGGVMRTCDIAEVLNCHQTHVRELCQSGELPAVQIGKRWFIPTVQFAALLESTNHTQA